MAVTINGDTGISKVQDGVIVAADIVADSVTASELNVSGNGTSGQYLISDGDGSFSWTNLTDLRDGITKIGLDSNDYVAFNTTNTGFFLDGSERARIVNNGDLHADGDVIAYSTTISDERLKTGINTVSSALDKVKQIRGVEFTRKNNGQRSAGVIAQEVEKVLPQAVKEKSLPLQTGTEDKYKTVEYDALHALLIEAVKELSDKIDKLENK